MSSPRSSSVAVAGLCGLRRRLDNAATAAADFRDMAEQPAANIPLTDRVEIMYGRYPRLSFRTFHVEDCA